MRGIARRTAYENLCTMALIDGEFSPRERLALRRCAEEWNLGPRDAEAVLFEVSERPRARLTLPRELDERRAHLQELSRIALADGILSHAERELLRKVSWSAGIDPEEQLRGLEERLHPRPVKTRTKGAGRKALFGFGLLAAVIAWASQED